MSLNAKCAARARKQSSLRRQAGFTLIEVLVVLLLFSVGLLGLVGLQAKALQISTGSEDSTRAALLANEMASAMWAANSLTVPNTVLDSWNTRVADTTAGGLPNGVGTVTVGGASATITLNWRAPQEPATATHQYVTQVWIPVPTPPAPPASAPGP